MKQGTLALITGSTGRLGGFLGKGFLDAGYRVVGLDVVTDVETAWPLVKMDGTSESSVQSAFETVVRDHGSPGVVIHTVGMWAMSPLAETTLKDWEKLVTLNLTTGFLVFSNAVKVMPDGGSLIGIASRQGAVRGASQQGAYSAAKGGLVRLVEAIADEYSGTGLHAHTIAPSTILFESGQSGGVHASELVAHCLYLASPKATSLSGSVLLAFGNG